MTASAMLRGTVMGGVGSGMGGVGTGEYAVAEEEVRSMIGLFAQLLCQLHCFTRRDRLEPA